MAWISVHEQVIGGKLRSLAKKIGCSQNEALGILIRLWLWGINNADKEGRIIGAEEDDVAEVLTVGIDSRYRPEDVVEALVYTNWIDIDDGLYIHDWEEWQKQWYKAIDVREKDAERKRRERSEKRLAKTQNKEQNVEDNNDKGMEQDLPTPKLNIPHQEEQKLQTVVSSGADYPEGFNKFWEVYPRKVGKGDAYKKYLARIRSGWSPEELTEAAKNYALKVVRDKTEKQYIKHPKTFLSDTEPFVDFLSKKKYENAESEGNNDNPYAGWR